MQIKKFFCWMCMFGMLGNGFCNAQTLGVLARKVGGVSLEQLRTQAAVRAQITRSVPTVRRHGAVVMPPGNEPISARRIASVDRLLNRLTRLPNQYRLFQVVPFESISLEAFRTDISFYVREQELYLPARSYIVRLPNGELLFSSATQPFDPQVHKILKDVFEAYPSKNARYVPRPSHWPGAAAYTDSQELARDVISYCQHFWHYSHTPYGPVRVYPVPDGVVYLASNGVDIVLSSQGPYVIVYEEKTKQAKMVNKEVYQLGEPDL